MLCPPPNLAFFLRTQRHWAPLLRCNPSRLCQPPQRHHPVLPAPTVRGRPRQWLADAAVGGGRTAPAPIRHESGPGHPQLPYSAVLCSGTVPFSTYVSPGSACPRPQCRAHAHACHASSRRALAPLCPLAGTVQYGTATA